MLTVFNLTTKYTKKSNDRFFNEHVETGKREDQVREVLRVVLEVRLNGAELA